MFLEVFLDHMYASYKEKANKSEMQCALDIFRAMLLANTVSVKTIQVFEGFVLNLVYLRI